MEIVDTFICVGYFFFEYKKLLPKKLSNQDSHDLSTRHIPRGFESCALEHKREFILSYEVIGSFS